MRINFKQILLLILILFFLFGDFFSLKKKSEIYFIIYNLISKVNNKKNGT